MKKSIYFSVFLCLLFALPTALAFGQRNSNGPFRHKVCLNGRTVAVPAQALQRLLDRGATLGACEGCIDERQKNVSVFCTTQYEPVCGCDNVTYSNACNAIYYGGVTAFTEGPCKCQGEPLNIFCPTLYDPVCGCDGNTYSNSCFAAAAGITNFTPGACGTGSRTSVFPGESNGELALSAAPSPFQESTTIQFEVPENTGAAVKLYNASGAFVSSLFDGVAETGLKYAVQLNGSDLPTGIYYLKLITEKEQRVLKLVRF